jgi:hypothetical protein
MHIRGKYPLKNQAEVKDALDRKLMGMVLEEEATDIVKYMYN